MNQLHLDNRVFQVPGNVNELSGRQLVWIAGLENGAPNMHLLFGLLMHPANGWSRVWLAWYFCFNLALVPFLDKLTCGIFTWTISLPTTDDVTDAIGFLTEWMATDDRPLVMPPVQRFWWLVGPKAGLSDLSFGQFLEAEQIFYCLDDAGSLSRLMAVLFLPIWVRWFPSLKHWYLVEHRISVRQRLIERRISKHRQMAVSQFYAGSRRAMVILNPDAFEGGKNSKGHDIKKLRKEHQDWFNNIAESPRNNVDTHNLPIWEVISSMSSRIREARRIEAEYRKNTPK